MTFFRGSVCPHSQIQRSIQCCDSDFHILLIVCAKRIQYWYQKLANKIVIFVFGASYLSPMQLSLNPTYNICILVPRRLLKAQFIAQNNLKFGQIITCIKSMNRSTAAVQIIWQVNSNQAFWYTQVMYPLLFSQFLNDNFDYDEVTALEQLAAYSMKNFMFDVAKVIIIQQ